MVKIVKVTKNEDGVQLVSARELWEYLDKPYGRFRAWFNKMKSYGYEEGVDFIEAENFAQKNVIIGRPEKNYALKLEMAKHLGMLARTPKGLEIRNYFVACEQKLQEKNQIKYNPRLMSIQDSVNRVAELEDQLRKVLTELKCEYAKLEAKSKYMREFVEKEGSVQFLEKFRGE